VRVFSLLNVSGRAALAVGEDYVDLAALGDDPTLADPMVAVARHRELHVLTELARDRPVDGPIAGADLGPPVPESRQVFGIGLNYRDHAAETGAEQPPAPLTFSKFPSCIAGPYDDVPLSGDHVDWEVELVLVVGERCRDVAPELAWEQLAGVTLGQDVSDRVVQRTGLPPQFCLGKSFRHYGPIGPALVSTDSLADRDDVELRCAVSGEQMQLGRTSQLIFAVPMLVAYLSSICELYPGDLVFTGTPSGVGAARGRYLREGDVITSSSPEIGQMANRCVAGSPPFSGWLSSR
jgi:2-keto-4-pentenoate hydratase/2-oxohepta-3-ene-1,7-dioic acid hydratase in catechol pathway